MLPGNPTKGQPRLPRTPRAGPAQPAAPLGPRAETGAQSPGGRGAAGPAGAGRAVLTRVRAVGHDQQAQGAEADAPLTSLSQERPVHVAGLHQRGPGCGGARARLCQGREHTEQAACSLPPGLPRDRLARSQLILSWSLSVLPTPAPPTAARLGLPCAGGPGDVGLQGGPRCEQTGWASFPALLSPAEAPAKRPTGLWFSSVRQGKQRQRPARCRARPTSHR